ncbi:hypothetical protein B0H15DRAFT_952739 [Mycena belliarum]|uniref:Uncharacterized protein n=1 Tax=Mycena belliarum TaxID=1033014 RepID=A0AAD6TZR8_9AGAR|nr:hypothetical protein B0H15DRAFT_952739 [Mycena belliae]
MAAMSPCHPTPVALQSALARFNICGTSRAIWQNIERVDRLRRNRLSASDCLSSHSNTPSNSPARPQYNTRILPPASDSHPHQPRASISATPPRAPFRAVLVRPFSRRPSRSGPASPSVSASERQVRIIARAPRALGATGDTRIGAGIPGAAQTQRIPLRSQRIRLSTASRAFDSGPHAHTYMYTYMKFPGCSISCRVAKRDRDTRNIYGEAREQRTAQARTLSATSSTGVVFARWFGAALLP